MIDRRTFLAGTGAVLLAAPLAAEAQQVQKIPTARAAREPAPSPECGCSLRRVFAAAVGQKAHSDQGRAQQGQ